MNVFTPPTDNLYKFLAIAGLLLMFAGWYAPITAVNTWGDKALPYTQGMTNVKYDQQLLDEDKQVAASRGKLSKQQSYAFALRQININRRRELLAPVGAPIVEYHQFYRLALRYGPVLFAAGLIAVAAGFVLWYRKLQRYQDYAVRLNPVTGALLELRLPPNASQDAS